MPLHILTLEFSQLNVPCCVLPEARNPLTPPAGSTLLRVRYPAARNQEDPDRVLSLTYKNVLTQVRKRKFSTVALPLIGTEAGYSMAQSLRMARDASKQFPDLDITLAIQPSQEPEYQRLTRGSQCVADFLRSLEPMLPVMPAPQDYALSERTVIFDDMDAFPSPPESWREFDSPAPPSPAPIFLPDYDAPEPRRYPHPKPAPAPRKSPANRGLFSALSDMLGRKGKAVDIPSDFGLRDESFSDALLRLIDQKGMTDVQCYKKAGITKHVFSRIRSGVDSNGRPYQPSKPTVLAFAVALELTLEETKELLARAGFALSPYYTFDNIVECCIRNGFYDRQEINLFLYEHDQNLLGL